MFHPQKHTAICKTRNEESRDAMDEEYENPEL